MTAPDAIRTCVKLPHGASSEVQHFTPDSIREKPLATREKSRTDSPAEFW